MRRDAVSLRSADRDRIAASVPTLPAKCRRQRRLRGLVIFDEGGQPANLLDEKTVAAEWAPVPGCGVSGGTVRAGVVSTGDLSTAKPPTTDRELSYVASAGADRPPELGGRQ